MNTRNGLIVHPAADIFPMMTDDELQELAADIAENGQRLPIILDQEGKLLIDGRNRLAACKIANVEPVFDQLAVGEDPVAFIADVNIARRDLSKGQKAMGLAMLYPEPAKLKRKGSGYSETEKQVSMTRLSEARAVLRYSRGLAEAVLKNTKTLDEALAIVKQEQQFQSSDEAKLARLQKSAPDLADQVNEERLKINEAIAALQAREQELKRVCEDARHAAQNIVGEFCGSASAIIMGVDNGERITVSAKELRQFHEMHALLLQRIPEFAALADRQTGCPPLIQGVTEPLSKDSAESIARNLREFIKRRREEINTRPRTHRSMAVGSI